MGAYLKMEWHQYSETLTIYQDDGGGYFKELHLEAIRQATELRPLIKNKRVKIVGKMYTFVALAIADAWGTDPECIATLAIDVNDEPIPGHFIVGRTYSPRYELGDIIAAYQLI